MSGGSGIGGGAPHVTVNEIDDRLHPRPRLKDTVDPDGLKFFDVNVRNDPAKDHEHVPKPLVTEQLH